MKIARSRPAATGWSAESDRRFSATPLGRTARKLLDSGSPSQKKLSEFVLRDPVFVATHGIEEVSKETGVSPSTLSRYVRDLGLERYVDFRAAVADIVRDLIAPVAKLREEMAREERGGVAERSLAAGRHNVEALGAPETAERIRAVVPRLAAAGHVWVMGFGLSAHLAAMLTLGLQPYREGVVQVVQYGGTEAAAARLMAIAPEDVLVALAFPRYSSEVAGLSRYARGRGARVVAITDSTASPIAGLADDLLLAPAAHPVLSSSGLAALALIEALVAEFLLSDERHLERARLLATAMADYIGE
jgi:DNA-binding MurR/RpiR family transcriptional regulator